MEDSTQARILDAAEALFIEFGYAGTSLRSITVKAGVNLAAVNYHFGSKEGLLASTIHRRVMPINQLRLTRLKELMNRTKPPSVAVIIQAFFQPFFDPEAPPLLHRLIARVFAEPPSMVGPILENEFKETAASYVQALSKIMPKVPATKIAWQLNLCLGASFQAMNESAISQLNPVTLTDEQKLTQLMEFCTQGMTLLETAP